MNVPADKVAAQDQLQAEAKRLVRCSIAWTLTALEYDEETGEGEFVTVYINPDGMPAVTRGVNQTAHDHAARMLAGLDDS
jgi:hypothetical protein